MSCGSDTALVDIVSKLTIPNQPKDVLLKLLKHAASLLSEEVQSPLASTDTAMKGLIDALVLPALIRHKDKDVKLLVATCISEVMRIVAPDAPYEDDVLKEIFYLNVAIFQGLNDISSPSFTRRLNILETVSSVRSCLVMLDLDCDDLILEMFHLFFNTISKEHPSNVFLAMRNILCAVLEESSDIPFSWLDAVLRNLLKDRQGANPAAHSLAAAVVERCAGELQPYVQRFLNHKSANNDRHLQGDYHELIYEIYRCAPKMELAIIPNLTHELVTDEVDVRLKAVELLGRLFSLPGWHMAQEYRQLFSEFLKRFSDKSVEVRLAVVSCAKTCLEANPTGPEAADILAGLDDRLLDFDDKVRMLTVKSVCDLVNANAKWVSMDLVKHVAERLRDKKIVVRKDTLQKLAKVYLTYTTKCKEGKCSPDELFEWIPSKILRCCYDKDFRPQAIEVVFTDDLFGKKVPVEQRAKHWIAMFTSLDKNEQKAFESILALKQRLQLEMQTYLSLRKKIKDEDTPELQKKIQTSFKAIAALFVDPIKADENLQKMHQLKDNNVFKLLNLLLSPSTPFVQAQVTRDDLLKRIGEKHPQHDFVKALATKCSFLLFSNDHVKAVLKELKVHKESGSKELIAACMFLLVEFATFFPGLLEGTDEDLLALLKENDESIKEGVVHILAKAGGCIRGQIVDSSSSMDLTLEQLCLEGSRRQAKHAVSAISAISADGGLKALSVLYGRLVDLLEDAAHLPTILQSLGSIAVNAMPVFETREDDIIKFVVRNLLRRETDRSQGWTTDWNSPSQECLLKIYGIKTLVKSFLPKKDAHLRTKLKSLIVVLGMLLAIGEISEDIKSSDIDKAHIRLAAAKAVLRLARRWESQITPDVVLSAMALTYDPVPQVRDCFLAKVHQYLKERSLHHKYASAYALAATDTSKEIVQDVKRYLADFIENSRREFRGRHSAATGLNESGTNINTQPEYVLVYVIHFLAHHHSFPAKSEDTEPNLYEPFYRQLSFFLRALILQDGDARSEGSKKEDVDNWPAILAIFRNVKNAEDAVEPARSEGMYTLCDIGIFITKDLGKKKQPFADYPSPIPLPSTLYKPLEASEADTPIVKEDGSHLPPCFADSEFLLRLRVGAGSKPSQPSSPRGHKRERKEADGNLSHVGEKEEEGIAQLKKTKTSHQLSETGIDHDQEDSTGNEHSPATETVLASKKTSKENGISKAAKSEKSDKEGEDVIAKPKRGRPKGSGSKSKGVSPSQAGPSKEMASQASGKKSLLLAKEKAKADSDDTPTSKKVVPVDVLKKKQGSNVKLSGDNSIKDEEERKNVSKEKHGTGEASPSPAGVSGKSLKKSSVPAVEKNSASKESDREADDELIGRKIKVWWPLDNRFYEGQVVDYNPKKKKHKILYDDGEVEHLVLVKERWELVGENKPKKKVNDPSTSPTSPPNSSGRQKRKATSAASESENITLSEKRRSSPRGASVQVLQGLGRGLAQAKSGSLSSPSAKSTKMSTSISAGPFAFSDEDHDETGGDDGGRKQAVDSNELTPKGAGTQKKGKRKENSTGENTSEKKPKTGAKSTAENTADKIVQLPSQEKEDDDEEPLDTVRSRRRKFG